MIIYRQHKCSREHRTPRAFVACAWPHIKRRGGIHGSGEYMFLTWCNGMAQARLFAKREEALSLYNTLSMGTCGARCDPEKHRVGKIEVTHPYESCG